MTGPVVVISPAELRALITEAVREALDQKRAPRRAAAPIPISDTDRAAAREAARRAGLVVRSPKRG